MSYQSDCFQEAIFQEAIVRIIQVSQHDVRQILQAEGRLTFPRNGLHLHSQLSPEKRGKLFALVEQLKASAASISAAQKLVLESPGLRSIQIEVADVNESLIDTGKTLKQQQQFREILQLEARCQTVMRKIRHAVAITDHNGWHLDCNYTKQNIGLNRMDAIGALAEEIFPQLLSDLLHEKLAEAFRYLNVPVHWEFTHESIPGIPRRFRAKTTAYGWEALTLMVPTQGQCWLS